MSARVRCRDGAVSIRPPHARHVTERPSPFPPERSADVLAYLFAIIGEPGHYDTGMPPPTSSSSGCSTTSAPSPTPSASEAPWWQVRRSTDPRAASRRAATSSLASSRRAPLQRQPSNCGFYVADPPERGDRPRARAAAAARLQHRGPPLPRRRCHAPLSGARTQAVAFVAVHVDYRAVISANGHTIVERDKWMDTYYPDGSARTVGNTVHIQGPGPGLVQHDAGQIVFGPDGLSKRSTVRTLSSRARPSASPWSRRGVAGKSRSRGTFGGLGGTFVV